MFHVCAKRFDLTENLEKFLVLGWIKQSLSPGLVDLNLILKVSYRFGFLNRKRRWFCFLAISYQFFTGRCMLSYIRIFAAKTLKLWIELMKLIRATSIQVFVRAKSFTKGKFNYCWRKNVSNKLCKRLFKFSSSPSHLIRSLHLDSLSH